MIVIVWVQIKIKCIKSCENKKVIISIITKVLLLYRLDTSLISIGKIS